MDILLVLVAVRLEIMKVWMLGIMFLLREVQPFGLMSTMSTENVNPVTDLTNST
jgi:hypothetical protein